jgi:hypothetical protein
MKYLIITIEAPAEKYVLSFNTGRFFSDIDMQAVTDACQAGKCRMTSGWFIATPDPKLPLGSAVSEEFPAACNQLHPELDDNP